MGLAAAAHHRAEFNAQTCISASDVIRQPRCPNTASLFDLTVFRTGKRKSYYSNGVLPLLALFGSAAMSALQLPAQLVDATQALNLSAGVSNCKVSRGRSFS